MRIFQCQQERECDQRVHSLDLLQQRHLRVTLLRQGFDAFVVLADPLAQLCDRRQQRFQCSFQFRTQPFGFLRTEVAHVAAAPVFAVTVGQPACPVDQSRSRPHYPARARITAKSACACALRCYTGYSNSGSIRASRANACASRRSSFLRLSKVSRTLRAFATITSCPNPLSKRLIQGESRFPARCDCVHCAEEFLQCFRTHADSLLQLDLACFIHHAVPTAAISQIQPDGEPLLRKIPAWLCSYSANLLHCRSPFTSCASSTSITWERTPASRPETGLLISSDYANFGTLPL